MNRRHIKIAYLLTAPEPARGLAMWEAVAINVLLGTENSGVIVPTGRFI